MIEIKKVIKEFKEDNILFDDIYYYYEGMVFKLARKFYLTDSIDDIILKLYLIIINMDMSLFKDDLEIDKYVSHSLKNSCIDFYRKRVKSSIIYDSKVVNTILNSEFYSKTIDTSLINFYEIIDILPERQRKILDLKYRFCFSDTEISNRLNISRQAVNKNIKLALIKLKNNITG